MLTTAAAGQPDGTSAPAEPIKDLSTILGTDDPRTLVGRRVQVTVPVVQDQTLTKFWIGPQEDRMLVVLGRDTRGGAERQASVPPEHGIVPLRKGQQAVLSGIVDRVPRPEERFSWDLTAAQTRELERRGAGLRGTAEGDRRPPPAAGSSGRAGEGGAQRRRELAGETGGLQGRARSLE